MNSVFSEGVTFSSVCSDFARFSRKTHSFAVTRANMIDSNFPITHDFAKIFVSKQYVIL